MTRIWSRRAGLIALLVLAAVPARAMAADKLVLDDPEAEQVASARGLLVFVGQDTSNRDVLRRQRGATVKRLRSKTAADLKDLDLGTDRRGRTVLVFSRCGDLLRRSTCKLYEYDFRRAKTLRVHGVSRRGCEEAGPSISRGTLVFVRRGSRRRCKPGIYAKRPGRHGRRIALRRAGSTDFQAGRIAFTSGRRGKPTVEVMRVRGKARAITRFRTARTGDALLDPTLRGGRVYWVERKALSADPEQGPDFRLRRRGVSGRGATRSVRLNTTAYTGFALRPSGKVLYSSFSDVGPGGIFEFRPRFR